MEPRSLGLRQRAAGVQGQQPLSAAVGAKPPEGRLSLDNGSFVLPLKTGDNEIAVAVANNFYGWGLILRLEDLEGLRLARK